MRHLRLSIEPIPHLSRLASLAKLLPRSQWDRIRRYVYRKALYHCYACGRQDRLHCHEIWGYNIRSRRQWLHGFQALCPACHQAKHVLFARNDGQKAKLLKHLATVNRLTFQQAMDQLREAQCRQHQLDQIHWIITYGPFTWQMPAVHGIKQRRAYALHRSHAKCR